MKFTISSRKHGEVTFSRPGSSYVFVDLNGQPGTLGQQPCHGGSLGYGSTITADGSDRGEFEDICRRWWKQYLRNQRQYEVR